MGYHFTVDGWQDWNGGRHEGEPPDIDEGDDSSVVEQVQGMFVHAVNDDDSEDESYFWTFIGAPFEDWDEWFVLIGAMMDMHGMGIA